MAEACKEAAGTAVEATGTVAEDTIGNSIEIPARRLIRAPSG